MYTTPGREIPSLSVYTSGGSVTSLSSSSGSSSKPGGPRDWLSWYRSSTPPGWKSRGELEGISSKLANFGDVQALEKTEKLVNDIWQEKFNEQPYSSFHMISWLMMQAGVTGEELWKSPVP